MFRRKGLFWYHQSKSLRYFDWSSVISSSVYGFSHPTLSRKIKNNYKKQFTTSVSSYSSLKSKLGIMLNYQPTFASYSFFLLDDFVVSDLFKLKEVYSEELELQTDPLLNSISRNTSPTNSTTLITDYYILYNELIGKQLPFKKNNLILYTSRLFPYFNHNQFTEPLHLNNFSSVIVGGHHPFGINGQKLFITRDHELINKITSNKFHLPNEWHLAVYQEGVKNIFDKVSMLRNQKRANLFRQEMELLLKLLVDLTNELESSNLIKSDKDKIKLIFCNDPSLQKKMVSYQVGKISITGTLAETIIGVTKGYSEELNAFNSTRLFIPDHTLNYQITTEGIDLFIHLPFDYAEHHFKNKCKSLVSRLAQIFKHEVKASITNIKTSPIK